MQRETITAHGVRRLDLVLPATPLVRVVYMRGGVQQGAVISNPRTSDRLQAVMLARNVGMSQVQRIEALGQERGAR